MISYDKADHMDYVEQRMYRICQLSGLPYETVTKENYLEISAALGYMSEQRFFLTQAELRSLYMDKFMTPHFEEVE